MARPRTRIDTIKVTVVTGIRGTNDPVRIRFNGVALGLHRMTGGTESGETYEGEYFLAAVVKSCALLGPLAGTWDIRSLEAEYTHTDGQRTLVRAGPVALDADAEVDLLQPPMASSFAV